MAYSENLATRIRTALSSQPNLDEMKMFGGIGFLVNGNMACGVIKNDLIVRVGAEAFAEALSRPNVKVFDMTGRPMKGWVMVEPQGCDKDADLEDWVEQGLRFAQSLPAK